LTLFIGKKNIRRNHEIKKIRNEANGSSSNQRVSFQDFSSVINYLRFESICNTIKYEHD